MNILGLAWIGIVGASPETRNFYRDVLGLRLLDEGSGFAQFEVGGVTELELLDPATAVALQQRADAPAIGFLVADLEDAMSELEAAGVRFAGPIGEWRAEDTVHRWAYFTDPGGTVLLLVERKTIG